MTEGDGWEAGHRPRRALVLGAAVAMTVAIAILLGIGQYSPTWHLRFLERPMSWLVPDRGSAPAPRGEEPPPPKNTDSSPISPAAESKISAPRAAMTQSAHEATEAPAPPRTAEPRATSPSLPGRSPDPRPASPEEDGPSVETRQALAPAPETSEERMADFLIEQLGPAPAAEKARSTAAWYDADRSEHAYWQRVAEAIRRRGGSEP